MMKKQNTYLKIYLNSTVFFLLAYFFIAIFSQLSTLIMTLAYEYEVVWKYYGVLINTADKTWSSDAVKTIYSAAPVFQLLCGFVFLAIYTRFRDFTGLLKQFFLWGFILAFHAFFINILIGGIFNVGFGHVLRWAYIGNTGRLIHVLIGLGGIFISGYLSGKSVLIAANSYFNKVEGLEKLNFFLYQILFPFLSGLVIIYLIRIPFNHFNNYLDLVSIASFILICFFLFIRFTQLESLIFDEDQKKPYLFTPAYVALFILLLLYRVGLSFNLQLG